MNAPMDANWQTWAALGVVAIAAALLAWRAWRRRGNHDGCDCAGARAGRELNRLRRRR